MFFPTVILGYSTRGKIFFALCIENCSVGTLKSYVRTSFLIFNGSIRSVVCFAYPVVILLFLINYRMDKMAMMCTSLPKLQVKNQKRVGITFHLRKKCPGIGWRSNFLLTSTWVPTSLQGYCSSWFMLSVFLLRLSQEPPHSNLSVIYSLLSTVIFLDSKSNVLFTLLLKILQLLPGLLTIKSKLLAYKTLYGLAPGHISNLI